MSDATSDPSGQAAQLTERLELPLLGVPVAYSSNSPALIGAAAGALAIWRDLPPSLVEPGPPARITIIAQPRSPGEPEAPPRGPFVTRAHAGTFLAASGGNLLSAHPGTGSALAFITPELLADEADLRHSVIERLGLLLVSFRDRTPIRAAGVVRDGRAILLAGPGDAGLPTLCYACLRAGLSLLGEDTIWVSQARGLRVWGHPGSLHLAPDAPRFFPELAALKPRAHAGGQRELVVDVAALGPGRVATHAERAIVCIVERVSGQASHLEPVPAEVAAAALGAPPEPAMDLPRDRAYGAAAALAARGAYRLSVGADPASAAALLAHMAASAGAA